MRTIHLLLLLGVLAAGVRAQDDASPKPEAKDGDFFTRALARVELGPPTRAEQLIVIPLLADPAPEGPAVRPGLNAGPVLFEEPLLPDRRFDVKVSNVAGEPVLLLGGTVLAGGKIDRMLPRDLIVAGGASVEVHALPAAYQQTYRSRPRPFHDAELLAPAYLRDRALTDPDRNLVPRFVSHFLRFRNKGDDRLTLAAIHESDTLARYCIECRRKLADSPAFRDERVVGIVTAVRGRIQSFELFGSNRLLRPYLAPILEAHAYAAAALALRAKDVGLPLPAGDAVAAAAQAHADAAKMIERLRGDLERRPVPVPHGAAGEALRLRAGDTNGYAVGFDGKLVHAYAFPRDPLEARLYAERLRPPPPPRDDDGDGDEDEERPTLSELERRERLDLLTPYEKRLLDRLRGRRPSRGE